MENGDRTKTGKFQTDPGRVPFDAEAEQAVLGGMLRNPEWVVEVAEQLSPSDFYLDAHHDVYQAILALSMEDRPPDLILLSEYLGAREKLDDLGGIAFLRSLLQSGVGQNVKHYLAVVKRLAQVRRVIQAGLQIADIGYNHQGQDGGTILSQAETALLHVSDSGVRERGQDEHAGGDLADRALQRMRDAAKRGLVTGLSTGFLDLDRMTAGLQPGTITYLAGRPGMGKSAFALNVARNVAKDGKRVLFYTLEMPDLDMETRLFSMESFVPFEKIKKGTMTEGEWKELDDARERFRSMDIIFHKDSYMTVSELRMHLKRHMSEHAIDLVVLDYVQILKSDAKQGGWNRVAELDAITQELQRIASSTEVPFLSCAQIGRGPEAREDHRPKPMDLRESGGIENTADTVLLMYRDVVYDKNTAYPKVAEIEIAKQRSGPTGTISFLFQEEIQRFANLSTQREDN